MNVIADQVGANRGTTKYHLRVLERDEGLRVLRSTPHARYFPPSTNPRDLPLFAVLLRGRVLELARKIAAEPGAMQQDLTDALPMSRKVFRQYANLLVQQSLVKEDRKPHMRRYYPTNRLERLLSQLEHRPSPTGRKPLG